MGTGTAGHYDNRRLNCNEHVTLSSWSTWNMSAIVSLEMKVAACKSVWVM